MRLCYILFFIEQMGFYGGACFALQQPPPCTNKQPLSQRFLNLSAPGGKSQAPSLLPPINRSVGKKLDLVEQRSILVRYEKGVRNVSATAHATPRKLSAEQMRPKNARAVLKQEKRATYGTRLFFCNICSKSYRNNWFLKKHLKKKHRVVMRFQCHVTSCGKWYSKNDRLKEHIRVYHHKAPFACYFCYRFYQKRRQLRKHLRDVHYL